ncbi:sodium/hydrogen exchanger 8 isoform X2 [Andrographis paniculata]|uniref:sodium/hydrogen exchanger 8 isoform X2 n=1 Tax=Andrographis paniculata TaxID=175694 RepID=UPI0021E82880|nr:sodium/hydrogen exchanger 8 isoform X2 [Andrographis paniculata]
MALILNPGVASSPLMRLLEEDSSSGTPTDAVIFVGISLVLGIACRQVLKGTRVPYTVALLVLGIGLGALEHGTSHQLGKIGNGIRIWANIDPDLLLAVFLPALLFESSFLMEVHQIKRCLMQMILLAGPGVLISTFLLGAALKLAFPFDWSWKTSLLLGGLLSATDPVAVVALLKDLGASKKLSTIIEGESLMNDGTAIVVYQLFYRMVLGWSFNWGSVIKFLSQVSLGAVGLGIAFGIASVLWLGFIFNDTVIEISLTLGVSYVAYFTAQEGVDVSGVLTVMTLGMFYSAVARTAFKGESQQSLHHFWEMVAYIANTLIFILSGVVIAESVLRDDNIFKTYEHVWGYLFLLYAFVQLSRVVVVGVLFPLLKYFGYGLDFKEATILVWSGLRGAVALSLSLSVKQSSHQSVYISHDTGALFVFLTGGIVFLTLIVNGSTTQFVLHYLQMDKLSAAKERILNYTKYEMLNKALAAFRDLAEDEELGPVEWLTVKRYITSLDEVEGECIHPHSLAEHDDSPDRMNLKDIRVRFLNGVQAAYWVMLDEGRITQTTANILMQSVDEAIDLVVSNEDLCDWRESACYICAAFLRAHRLARQQLRDFIGDSDIAAKVIRESEQEGEEARMFLEEVRVSFPQVLRAVKTRQVTYSVLNHLIDYVHNLEKIGLLDEKEMAHLHDAVQTDLKKLLRNPPLVKVPKIRDLVASNPLLGALPSSVRDMLTESTKEIMKLSGATLYKEGSEPAGIWLISNGVVKWSSKSISDKHLLRPILAHGSTLGLYEVLAEKPHICDIVTDSVVHCFFVETEKIRSAVRSDTAVEDFFWRESVIVLAKLMLPHIFEKMSLQDFRTLIAERSTMRLYIPGESFELLHHSVGFLLEGYIKLQGADEMLTAPAAVLTHAVQTSRHSETMGNRAGSSFSQVQVYQVETRARVLVFDTAGFEAGRSLRKRPSSLISHSGDHLSRSFTRGEHGELMSWPQQFFSFKRQDSEIAGGHVNNLSARALQISMFGSMINIRRKRTGSFPRSKRTMPSHSLSYPNVTSAVRPRPMVSVKSEGSSTLRHKFDMQSSKQESGAAAAHLKVPGGSRARLDESTDDDDDDDAEEHIIRIDSPSRLFH